MRGGGQAAADLIDRDDEILFRIERPVRPDISLLHDLVRAGEPSRNEDGVALRLVQHAVRRVRDAARP